MPPATPRRLGALSYIEDGAFYTLRNFCDRPDARALIVPQMLLTIDDDVTPRQPAT